MPVLNDLCKCDRGSMSHLSYESRALITVFRLVLLVGFYDRLDLPSPMGDNPSRSSIQLESNWNIEKTLRLLCDGEGSKRVIREFAVSFFNSADEVQLVESERG